MSKDPTQKPDTSVGTYILIAVVLAIITYLEFAIVEYDIAWLDSTATLAWLVIMSVIKFILVVAFFMHLKQDDRIFTGFFSSGMAIAVGTLLALSILLTVRSLSVTNTPQLEVAEIRAGVPVAEGELGHAQELYAEACSSCHALDGLGTASVMPPLVQQMPLLLQADGGRAHVINTLLYGLEGPIQVLGDTYDGIQPAQGYLHDEELADILNYSAQAWGNDQLLPDFTPFTAEEVAERRGEALSAAQVYSLRQALTLPQVATAPLLRRRPLTAQLDTPEPKYLRLDLGPDSAVSEYRTPTVPGAQPINPADAPPEPRVEQNGYAPLYEPGSAREHGDGDPDTAIEERAEAGTVDPEEAQHSAPLELGPGHTATGATGGESAFASSLLSREGNYAPLGGTGGVTLVETGEAPTLTTAPPGDVDVLEAVTGGSVQETPPAASTVAPLGATQESTPPAPAQQQPAPPAAPNTAPPATAPGTAPTAATTGGAAEAATQPPQAAPAAFDWQELGTTIYTGNCSSCHQPNGEGIVGAFPPLAGHMPELLQAEDGREYLINVLLYGLQGEINVEGQTYNGVMTAWASLGDEQIAAVLNHESTSWGNADALSTFEPFQPGEIAAQRGLGLSSTDVYELRQTLGLE